MRKRRDLPALDLLKAFAAAARHLSFTKAAAELNLSQSAVSRQIQNLEDQLGVRLFVRRTRALLLTEAGQRYARDVADALERLRAATARLGGQAPEAVTVTTTVTFASLWLVPRLADFQQQHPEVNVHVAADNAVRDLDRDQLDLAIRYAPRRVAGSGAVKLFGESVVPVCSPRLPGRERLKRPEDLADFVLLHFEDPGLATPWISWDVWFEAMRVRPVAAAGALRFSHYDQAVRAAISGQGLALGRLPLIGRLIQDGTLVTPFAAARFSTTAADRAYWLCVSEQSRERTEVRTFVGWLREQAAATAAAA